MRLAGLPGKELIRKKNDASETALVSCPFGWVQIDSPDVLVIFGTAALNEINRSEKRYMICVGVDKGGWESPTQGGRTVAWPGEDRADCYPDGE